MKKKEVQRSAYRRVKQFLAKIRTFSFSGVRKKKSKMIKENENFYNHQLQKIQDKTIEDFNGKENFLQNFQYYIFLKQMSDKSSVFGHLLPDVNYEKFYLWYNSKALRGEANFLLEDKDSLRSYFLKLIEEYRLFEVEHASWKIWTPKKDKKLFVKMKEIQTKISARKYNQSISIKLTEIKSLSEFKKHIAISTLNFKTFEDNFNGIGLTQWMNKKGHPSYDEFHKIKLKHPNYTVGDYVMTKYFEYAPYAKFDEKLNLPFFKRQAHLLKENFGKMKSKLISCHGRASCIKELLGDNLTAIFKKKSWRTRFSCLNSQPALLTNAISDLALFTATQVVIFNLSNPDRFPWEFLFTATTFNFFHDEANCRASRSPLRNFGKIVDPTQLKASKHLLWQFMTENFKSMAITTAYSSLGFTIYNMAFNSLYISMGYPLSENISLIDGAIMFGFNYFHFGPWGIFKKVAFWLPLRHGVLPKVVRNLQKRFPGRLKNGIKFSDFYNRIIEAGFYIGMSAVNFLDYMYFYKTIVIPKIMDTFSLDVQGLSLEDQVKVHNKSKKIKEIKNETTLDKDSQLFVNTIEYANGLQTRILFEEKYNKKEKTMGRIILGVDYKNLKNYEDEFFDDLFEILQGNTFSFLENSPIEN